MTSSLASSSGLGCLRATRYVFVAVLAGYFLYRNDQLLSIDKKEVHSTINLTDIIRSYDSNFQPRTYINRAIKYVKNDWNKIGFTN